MRATTAIPPLLYLDYPVDIQLRIYSNGTGYNLDIFALDQIKRISIRLSLHDLVVLNKRLQVAAENISRNGQHGIDQSKDELDNLLRPLAEVGNYIFKQIFGYYGATQIIQELFDTIPNATIQIASENFFLPWELLYPQELDESLSFEHFWGMNHIISRIVVQETRPGSFVPPLMLMQSRPKLGLLINDELPAVIDVEVPFFEKLHDQGEIQLLRLRNLNSDPQEKLAELKEFKALWSKGLDLAHFACHVFYEEGQPDKSHFLISDAFPVTLMDLDVYEFNIIGFPLVIMNTCTTGNIDPRYTSDFASTFLRYGARGVIATEGAITDTFAAAFTEQLYCRLLNEEPLGQSVLDTRKYFLKQHYNPSGLLYSMYAPPSIRLVTNR